MTALKDVLFGTPIDPRPIAGVLFGAAPAVLKVQPGAVPVVGGVILPVPGPRGVPGPPGTGLNYTQVTPSTLWTINHNLGYYPTVSTFTTGGVEIEGGILHLSPNIVQIDFAGPLAGSARLI